MSNLTKYLKLWKKYNKMSETILKNNLKKKKKMKRQKMIKIKISWKSGTCLLVWKTFFTTKGRLQGRYSCFWKMKCRYLVDRITGVPQSIPHHLSWSGCRSDELELDARFCHGSEGRRLPVRLRLLLPHHRIEIGIILVAVT